MSWDIGIHLNGVHFECARGMMMKRVSSRRLLSNRFGWNWLDIENWCDGLMDDQGNFIPEYRLFKEIDVSVLLYLTKADD